METQQKATSSPSLLGALAAGVVGLFSRKRIWLIWWLGNLAAAALVIAPIAGLLQSRLGWSLAGRKLPSANDFGTLMELYRANPQMPFALIALLAVVFALYGIWSLCLLSGTLPLLRSIETEDALGPREPTSLGAMFSHGMTYWPRLFRLFLVSLLVYGLYFWAFGFVRRWLRGLVKGSTTETPVAYVSWLSLSLLLLGFFLIKIFFDVVKIRMVVDDVKSALKATWRSLRMCSFRLSRFVGLFVVTGLLSFLLTLLYRAITQDAAESSLRVIFYIFCAQQLLLIGRIGLSLTYYIASVHWYEQTSAGSEDESPDDNNDPLPYDEDPLQWDLYEPYEAYDTSAPADPKAAESLSKAAEAATKED